MDGFLSSQWNIHRPSHVCPLRRATAMAKPTLAKPTLAKPALAKPGAMQETSPPMSRPSIAELALSRVRSAPPDHPFVVAQLGQSLDGRIATISGDSRGISGPDALDHLHA